MQDARGKVRVLSPVLPFPLAKCLRMLRMYRSRWLVTLSERKGRCSVVKERRGRCQFEAVCCCCTARHGLRLWRGGAVNAAAPAEEGLMAVECVLPPPCSVLGRTCVQQINT